VTAPAPMSPADVAGRWLGVHELPGGQHHPLVQLAHMECGLGPDQPDETAWCSSFANLIARICGVQRSKSAMARSWLKVGEAIDIADARPGHDVAVFWRGRPDAPTGHIGFYLSHDDTHVLVRGGNQGDAVSDVRYPRARLLGTRRLSAASES
jgi:uncharacterized protein (TIGR02594 family)